LLAYTCDQTPRPAISKKFSQKPRGDNGNKGESDLDPSPEVLDGIGWFSPSVVLCIPLYRERMLLPPSCELGGMITKAYAALEGRVIIGTINLTKVAV
jgi:hypothetical protein